MSIRVRVKVRVRVRNNSASVFRILPVSNFPHFAFYPLPFTADILAQDIDMSFIYHMRMPTNPVSSLASLPSIFQCWQFNAIGFSWFFLHTSWNEFHVLDVPVLNTAGLGKYSMELAQNWAVYVVSLHSTWRVYKYRESIFYLGIHRSHQREPRWWH